MKTLYFVLFLTLFTLSSCVEENLDPEGTCVTCMTDGTPSETIIACANGDGTITLNENGVETLTSQNTLADFQANQEGSGSTCF